MCAACISAAAQSVYPGATEQALQLHTSAPLRARSFALEDVRVLPGRVHDNIARDSAWMASIPVRRLLHNFRTNAGVFAGREGGYDTPIRLGGWESPDCDLRGHITGHLLSAYGLMYAATGDELFRLKGDSLVAGLAEVQQALGPDGYLSAFPEELINRNIRGKSVWAPWYTLHKILAGLLDQYVYGHNGQALEVARRMGSWAAKKVGSLPEETRRLMLRNEFGGINESLYNLYAATADSTYLRAARFFYHNDVLDPLARGDFDMGTKHCNTFLPKLLAEARNYELCGDTGSRDMVREFWGEMLGKHAFATGSLSQKEHFFNPDEMSRNINGYTGETCCTYNMLKLGRHIFCWDADASVADYHERALFNHILAQQDTASGMVCYFLPLLSGAYKVYSTPENSFWCCVGSGFESHAKYGEGIYYHGGDSDDELLVNLFIPSRLNWRGRGLRLTQTTRFPEEETVRLTIDEAPAEALAISLRHPAWCARPELRVNGKRVSAKTSPSGYMTLHRRWRKGDTVDVRYPMSLRVETARDDASRGALLYGPVVLAGDMGTEGMAAPAPFSDPTVRNDYYTYDYHVPADLNTILAPSTVRRVPGEGLHFATPDGRTLMPLYDAHHRRYTVYWNLMK